MEDQRLSVHNLFFCVCRTELAAAWKIPDEGQIAAFVLDRFCSQCSVRIELSHAKGLCAFFFRKSAEWHSSKGWKENIRSKNSLLKEKGPRCCDATRSLTAYYNSVLYFLKGFRLYSRFFCISSCWKILTLINEITLPSYFTRAQIWILLKKA